MTYEGIYSRSKLVNMAKGHIIIVTSVYVARTCMWSGFTLFTELESTHVTAFPINREEY